MKHLIDIFEGLLDDDFDVEISNIMVDFDKFENLINVKKPTDGIIPVIDKKCKYYKNDTIMKNWAKAGRYIGSKNEINRRSVDQFHNDGNCLIGISEYASGAYDVTIVYNGDILRWSQIYNEDNECVPAVTYDHNDRLWSALICDCQKIYSVAGFYFDKIKEIVGL